MEIRTFTAGWGTTGSFKFSILDANGEEVKSEVVSVSTQLEKNKQGDFQKNGIRVNRDTYYLNHFILILVFMDYMVS